MKVVFLAGALFGDKVKTVIDHMQDSLAKNHPGVQSEILNLADYEIPFRREQSYSEQGGAIKKIVESILEADALLIAFPVYQASIPGVLKNVIDFLPESALQDKVIGLLSISGSAKHYLVAEQQLKPILSYLKGYVLPKYVFAGDIDFTDNQIVNENLFFRMDVLVEETMILARTFHDLKETRNS